MSGRGPTYETWPRTHSFAATECMKLLNQPTHPNISRPRSLNRRRTLIRPKLLTEPLLVTQLTERIIPPAPDMIVGADPARMIRSRREQREPMPTAHHHWDRVHRPHRPEAKLEIDVLSPAPRIATRVET